MRHHYFIYAFILSVTTSVSTFLRIPRKADFYRLIKYEKLSVVSALESAADSARIETCVRDLEDHFPPTVSIIRKFHIHGWRWHTLSLLRDFSRLERLATRLSKSSSTDSSAKISKAIDHVIGFSWNGLNRIESRVFFPWLKQKLFNPIRLSGTEETTSILSSLEHVFKQIEDFRIRINQLSNEMVSQSRIDSTSEESQRENLVTMASIASSLYSTLYSSYTLQERIIVPAVALYVPEKDQKVVDFNVLRSLGIFDSRLHLVGMRDAVWEQAESSHQSGSIDERALFNEVIPGIPRSLIPRWRRTLYDPQAGILDDDSI